MGDSVSLVSSGTYYRPDKKKVDFVKIEQGNKQYEIECVSDGVAGNDYYRLIETQGSIRIEHFASRGDDSVMVSDDSERKVTRTDKESAEPTSRVCLREDVSFFTDFIEYYSSSSEDWKNCIEPLTDTEAEAEGKVLELMQQISSKADRGIVYTLYNQIKNIGENREPRY